MHPESHHLGTKFIQVLSNPPSHMGFRPTALGAVVPGPRTQASYQDSIVPPFGSGHVSCFVLFYTQTLHGTAIYAYIDPPNHPNVGIYGSPMECLG